MLARLHAEGAAPRGSLVTHTHSSSGMLQVGKCLPTAGWALALVWRPEEEGRRWLKARRMLAGTCCSCCAAAAAAAGVMRTTGDVWVVMSAAVDSKRAGGG